MPQASSPLPTPDETQSGGGLVLPLIPASAFGIVLGTAGLANSWRAASSYWGLPQEIGEVLADAGFIIWIVLIGLYGLKWLVFREEALEEVSHPVQCCFVGLIGVSTMLAAGAMLSWWPEPGKALFWVGFIYTIGFGVWRTGDLWKGGRDPSTTTAVLYLPTVAGSFVTAIVGTQIAGVTFGQMVFGAGLFSWLAIESVLLHRLLTSTELPELLRPTIGIQLAPPAVGSVAYLSTTSGPSDILVLTMFGYAVLQTLLMIRILPWVMKQRFSASYWAFTFGATSLATAGIKLGQRGADEPIPGLAKVAFGFANFTVGSIAIFSLLLLVRGQLFTAKRRAR
ncbi:dicarboxylate transporter/tellurite-resistance protein TehA [Rhizobium sp. LCM 4573]|uniref:dicarboxylate transporter/tellurite-resistance protein TehA n=1 Tax=Rhizobium sp. LCM 4573 TaxID=1848291 RepID=UPI0008D8DC12|nr:dicarboxylate transporter/tellurite-resistance protein TehA [Rhizobium sp. LCM 4573]OHV78680.1 dicarboxylate transporter/tellurite-resistance protein TehA [Rhizobium sp. LCM 4573]